MGMVRLRVRIVEADDSHVLEVLAKLTEPLSVVLARLRAEHNLPGWVGAWRFERNGMPVPLDVAVGELIGPDGKEELILVQIGGAEPGTPPAPAAPPAAAVRTPAPLAPQSPAPRMPAPAPAAVGSVVIASRRVAFSVAAAEAPEQSARKSRSAAAPLVDRRATVRHYSRMNPQRTFPLIVLLSAEQVKAVQERAVAQAESKGFKVEAGSQVEVEPILPGCDCYPPRDTVPVANEPVTATFWVVPHVLGAVQGARVVVRQNGAVLAEVPLDVRVRRQTMTVVLGLLGLMSPYLMMGLKSLKLDFETQKAEGFVGYRQAGEWAVANVQPGLLGLALLVAAAGCYLWARPRRKDVFWEVKT